MVEDADDGLNGRVTFTVNSVKFAVNASTGILYTTQPLDREQQAQYQLNVQATDGGGVAAKVGEMTIVTVVSHYSVACRNVSCHAILFSESRIKDQPGNRLVIKAGIFVLP